MSDLRKAAEMALDALEIYGAQAPAVKETIEALRQALAKPQTRIGEMEWHWGYERGWDAAMKLTQPKQDPVAWMKTWSDGNRNLYLYKPPHFDDNEIEALYTAPPKRERSEQREWVGLTDEDKREFAAAQYGWEDLLAASEAKLKEKNT